MSEKYSTNDSLLTNGQKEEIRSRITAIQAKMEAAVKRSHFQNKPRLLLATKTRTPEEINFAISLGVDLIGENRVQELCDKYDKIQKDGLEIHFIGALQTNKVKQIIDKVDMIQSLDRISLAKEIDKQAKKIGKVMRVLVEINVGAEESKSGIAPCELESFLQEVSQFENIQVCGLMAIPPKMENVSTQKQYFQKIMNLYIDILAKKIDNSSMTVLSFGMSSDFEVAIESGSNLVRIGTAAFGERNY